MGDSPTIVVKHLPASLSSEHIFELLKAFGATEIKTKYIGRQKKPLAFATFSDQVVADTTLRRLHQLEVSGSRLCVEYVTPANASDLTDAKTIENEFGDESVVTTGSRPVKRPKLTDNRPNINAISHALGLDYPLNPKIRYFYPPPNHTVLTNIMNCLVTVPKFYNQVLHLMNKMNLPSPFETVAMEISMGINLATSHDQMSYETSKSSDESELESDEEIPGAESAASATVAACRKLPRKTKKLLVRRSLQKPSMPSTTEVISAANVLTSEVFDLQDPLVAKKIEFNLTANALKNPDAQLPREHIAETGESFEERLSATPIALPSAESSPVEKKPTLIEHAAPRFITDEQLRSSRITKEGMTLLPVYKNYKPGPPTIRLYLKNLAKQVEEDDLKFIYGRFNEESEDGTVGSNIVDIRLMKDGRMKGQAFITFQKEAWAVEALNATNGYVLHGKPIVVQFARSTKPKEM